MARVPDLRQAPRHLLVGGGIATLAATAALTLQLLGGAHAHRTPTFLDRALGVSASPVQQLAPATPRGAARPAVTHRAFSLRTKHAAVVLATRDEKREPWTHFAHGVSRRTSYGRETITVGVDATEQFLTVDRHLGPKTWTWDLSSLGMTPRLTADGEIHFFDGGKETHWRIARPLIQDDAGAFVTPAGLRWSLDQRHGRWTLGLHVDDAPLPLPYTIDPAIALTGTCTGTGVANGCSSSTARNSTSLSLTVPAGVVNGDVMVAQAAYTDPTSSSAPTGWTQIDSATNAQFTQGLYYRVASGETAGTTSYQWTGAKNTWAGGIFAFRNVDQASPVDAVGTANTGSTGSCCSTATMTTGALATTQPNDMVMAFYGASTTNLAAASSGQGMTQGYSVGDSQGSSKASALGSSLTIPQAVAGPAGPFTATATSGNQSWIAQAIALRPPGPANVTLTPSRTTSGSTATWTAGFTSSSTGALAANGTVTVTFPAAFAAGLPASPAITFGGNFAGCGATTGSTSGSVVTVTLPAGCSLAVSKAATIAIRNITNPVANAYSAASFAVHTSADTSDASPATGVTITPATSVSAVSFGAGSLVYGATTNWTVGFTASAGSALAAGDTVVATFDPAFTNFPTPLNVTFGGAFAGCSAVTGSRLGAVVSVTLPAGCALPAGGTGQVVIQGIVNPAPGTYANTSFTVHTAADATDTAAGSSVTTTKAPLTVTGATATNRVYDATSAATVSFGGASLSGVVAGDTVSFSSTGYTASFASKAVGNGKAVTVAGVTLTGANASYYTLSQPTGLTANITAKALTVTGVTGANKVYDGGTSATVNTGSASLSGVIAGDTVTLGTGGASGSFASKTVGAGKTVTVSGLTISGADAGNYTLAQPTTTATITAKSLTVSGLGAANKVYDRTTAATLTGTAALSGVVAGDTVTLGGSPTAAFASVAVGTGKTVTVAGYTIAGADAANYTLTQPTLTADITAKPLTVTGLGAANKTYDRTTTATLTGTAALNGVVAGDTVTLGGSPAASFADKTVGTGKTVTVTGYALAGADAGNYALTQPSTTANITAKTLTVTGVTAADKVYDRGTSATLNTGSASLSGVIAGDTVTLGTSGASGSFATKTVGAGKTVTAAGLTIGGADAGNYTLTQPTATATITAAPLTVTGVTAQDKVYDRTTAATLSGAPLPSGVIGGDTVTIGGSPTAGFATASVGAAKPVTVTGYTLAGADAANYTLTQPTLAATITAKPLTVTGVTAQNKSYDRTTVAALTGTASLNGIVAGDTVTLGGTPSASFVDRSVGAGKTVTVSGYTLSGADAGNYTLTQPTLTATITAKNLTVTGIAAQDKVYDRTTAATLTGTASPAGVVAGDTVGLGGTPSATFADRNAGTAKTVTVSGYTLTGADAGNYTLTQPTLTANITAKTLTVTGVTAQDKVYDADTSVTLTGSPSPVGVLGADTVTIGGSPTASFATASVGAAKPVTVTGYTLGGADAANYTLSQPTLAASITRKSLTVSGATVADKVYDGTTAATLNLNSAGLNGVLGSDFVSIDQSGAAATFTTKNAGTAIPVTVTGVALGGTDAANYTLTQPTGLTADITPKALTIGGAAAQNKTYDGTATASVDFSAASLTGVLGSDDVTLDTNGYNASFASTNAATTIPVTVTGVTLAGSDAADYTVAQPTGLTADITKKALTVTGAVADDKPYDATTTATIDFGAATLTGTVGSDDVTLDTSGYSASFASANAGANIGVSVSGLTLAGTDHTNYTLTQPTGLAATIARKSVTVAGATATDKTYDGTTTATVDFGSASPAGKVAGDDLTLDTSGATAAFASRHAGSGIAVSVTGVALGGAARANYSVAQPTGLTATIAPRPLTVTAQPDTKAYDATTASSVLPVITSGSLAAGDTAGFGQRFATAAVGTGKTLTPFGSVADGNSGDDYTVAFVAGTGTITAATAARLVFTQAPASATGGAAFATQPEVAVEDAYGNVVTTDDSTEVTLSLGTNPSGGALTCPAAGTTATAVDGVATFAGCRIDRTGTGYTLTTANDGGLTNATSAPFDVVAVSTRLVIASVDGGAHPTAGTPFSVVVEAQDAVGNLGDVASDTPVTLSLAGGSGALGGTLTGTILAGTSSVTIAGVTYATAEAGVTLTASGGAFAAATSSPFTVDAGPATQLAITSVPPTATAGSPFSVTVEAQDALGNPSAVGADVAVTLGLDSHSGAGSAGTLSGETGTISSGSSSVTLSGLRYTRAETITLGAGAPGMTGSGSTPAIAIAPGSLAKLQLLLPGETAAPGTTTGKTGSPVQQTAAAPFTVTVNAVDANWNRVPSTDTVSLDSSDGAAQLPADAALAGGTTTLQVTLRTRGSGTQTVTASDVTDGSVGAATSAPVTLAVGAVSAARSDVSATATVVADGTTRGTVTVTLVDGGGNPVAGTTVALAQGSGHSTVSPASAVTDANGQAAFTVTSSTAEVVTYAASDTDDSLTLTQTAAVSFEDHVAPSATAGAPADGVTAAGDLTLSATGVSDGETGVASADVRYCDSTASACDPSTGTVLSAADAGAGTWNATLDTTGLADGHSYTWVAVAKDGAGNETTTASRTFSVDNSTPAVAVTAPTIQTGASAQHWDGTTSTLWLRGGASGSFSLNATAADAESGISKVSFPGLLGAPAADVTSGPYTSGTYSFASQPSDLTATVTATNGVDAGTGARTASAAAAIRVDSAGPTVTLDPSLDAATVTSGVVLQAASADGGSGVAAVSFLVCDRTATPLCAANVPAGSTSTEAAGVYSISWDTTGLVDGDSYAVVAESTDAVGNVTTSPAATVRVDDSAPLVAATAPTVSGDAYWDGTKLFVKATGTGSYTLHAQASDPDSSIAAVRFDGVSGTDQGGGDYATAPNAFDGSSTPVGSSTVTVTAANGVDRPAALTATDSLRIESDATAATTATQFPATSGRYDPNSWPNGSQSCTGSQPEGICGTVSDTGSGVAAVKLTLQDLGGGTYFDGSGFSAGRTELDANISGTDWSYPLAKAKLSTATYELKVYGLDRVGNVEAVHTIDFDYGTDLTPPDTQLTLSGTHAFLLAAGTHASPRAGRDYDLFYSTEGNGDFTLHAHSTDESGITSIAFPGVFGTAGMSRTNGTSNPWDVDSPSYAFGSSDTTPPGQAVVTSVDTRGNTGDDTLTFLVDDTKPADGSVDVSPVDAGGYATTLNLTLAHTPFADGATGSGMNGATALAVASAGLADGVCGSFGADAPVADGAFTATSGTCYRFTATGTDNVGNVATATQVVKVDATAPSTPTVDVGGLSAGNTYDDGTGTLWYRPSAGGSFTLTAAAADAESGIRDYTFSSLLGGTQSGGRVDVTFGAGGIGSGSYTVHATNGAALDSADTSFSVRADTAPPVGGALKVNGTDATATPGSSYLTSGSAVAIDARTDYTDADSGLASSTLTVEAAPLVDDACGAYGAPTTVTGTTQPVSNGNCYRFTLTGTDRVGNAASVSTVVKVDTTPPTTPGVVFSGLSAGNTFDAGNGTLWYRPSAGGAFTVTATGASDSETGVAGYTFSSLLGGAQTGRRLDVSFGAAGVGSGSYGVVATNGAGADSSPGPFTVTADTAAPTGGLLSTAPYSGSLTVALGETDFGDAESGIAANTLTRSDPQAPSGGACPAGGYTGATTVPVSGGAASDAVPADGSCYEYTLTGTDRVGNAATYRTIVLVDTTAPTGATVESPDGLTSLGSVAVDWNAGSDPESGIAQISVERASASLNGSTCDPLGGFTTIVSSASTSPVVDAGVSPGNCYAYRIVVTNHAGVAATFASSAVTKLTTASPITVAATAGGTYLAGTTLYVGPSATTFSLGLTGVGSNGVTAADWSTSAGSLAGAATTAASAPFASGVYTWDGTTPLAGSVSVTRQPTGTVDSLSVVSDTTAPTGSVQSPNGINPSHAVPVTTTGIADAQSGIDGDSIQILRSETDLVGATCSTTWSPYAPVTIAANKDTSVEDNHCYRYELVVSDNVGNQHIDVGVNTVEIPDVTPPSLSAATTDVSGAHLTLTMSEPLDASSVPAASRFTVFYDGVAQAEPTAAALAGSTIVLDLASPPDNGQIVTVGYDSDGSVRDSASPTPNTTPSFGPSAVTNATPDTVAPQPSSAEVDGATLTVRLDEPVAGNAPSPSAFTVTVQGTVRAVTAAATSGSTVTLTLDRAVTANETVLLTYAVPALDALHDTAGNPVAGFTSSVLNSTAAVVAPPAAPPVVPSVDAPELVTATPSDGVTVPAAGSLTLTANEPVAWSGMTLTRPDGTITPLPDGSGAAWTWTPGATAPGLYVVRGAIRADGRTTSVLSHFTVWTPGRNGTAPAVQKNGGGSADSLTSSDGTVTTAWSPSTFGEPVVVQIEPKSSTILSLPPSALAVDVTAFLRDSHTPVKQLGDVFDIQFRNAPDGSKPQMSQDASAWSAIDALPTLQLPADRTEGWFRDSDGTVHVLTRHLTYFALIVPRASTKLALTITTARRLWLDGRRFMAVRLVVTAPARVTGSFVASDGTVIPGQVIRTPTRRAGSTVLRFPLRVTKPGLYRLEVHADGIGQVVDRTARIRFVRQEPRAVWQSPGRLRVAMVDGVRLGRSALAGALGHGYTVTGVADADLYRMVDPQRRTAAAAVVVDLATVPLQTLASLHAVLPELRIVGVTSSPRLAAQARRIGIDAVAKSPDARTITHAIRSLVPVRR